MSKLNLVGYFYGSASQKVKIKVHHWIKATISDGMT